MRRFSDLVNSTSPSPPGGEYFVRWRGQQNGPYTESVINSKLAANELSLAHEISSDGHWITIREFLGKRDAVSKQQQEKQSIKTTTSITGVLPEKSTSEPVAILALVDTRIIKKVTTILVMLIGVCGAAWLVHYSIKAIEVTNKHAEYNKQRFDVGMKEGTKRVWRNIQMVEFQSASGNHEPLPYFQSIVLGYSQIDTENSDPELIAYVQKRVDAAKAAASLLAKIQTESEQSEAGRRSMQKIGELFGKAIGGIISSQEDSKMSVDSGMQLGGFFGELGGNVAGQLILPDSEILAKYKNEINRIGLAYDTLDKDRVKLGKNLGEKYQIVLIETLN